MKIEVQLILATSLAFVIFGALYVQSTVFQRYDKLKILIYETDEFGTSLETFLYAAETVGLQTKVVGNGSTFNGFGSKYVQLKDALEELERESDTLVAVIDGRDVLLNVGMHVDPREEFEKRVDNFVSVFHELTEGSPDAILFSAEQQCCVAALCHADSPSYYFDPVSASRKNRACSSGKEDCPWEDNENVKIWQSMMETEAFTRTESNDVSPYLNAGMMVGTAENLINLIQMMDLGEEEDDQAVLSAMYLQFPNLIVLDYGQELLGNNAWPKGLEHGCIYDFDPRTEGDAFLTNVQTKTAPLILHTPGKFYDCLDKLIERLGGVSDERHRSVHLETKRQLQYGNNYQYGSTTSTGSNYNGSNYGSTLGILVPTDSPVQDDVVVTIQPSPSNAPTVLIATTAEPTQLEGVVTIGTPGTAAPTEAPQARSFWSILRFWN